jgi:protein-S-isoprenylcysteine O-methyltransferase Ste14
MSTLVIVLRVVTLLALAWPMLLRATSRDGASETRTSQEPRGRGAVVTNFSAFGVFFLAILVFPGRTEASMALAMAALGCLLALAGAWLVLRSRTRLGPAWSFVPKADHTTGLVTAGPYRFVRHPIYLGLIMLAVGEALAFGSWPALLIVLGGIVPGFAWRARVEEALLRRTFGERYESYRRRTKMIIPYVL